MSHSEKHEKKSDQTENDLFLSDDSDMEQNSIVSDLDPSSLTDFNDIAPQTNDDPFVAFNPEALSQPESSSQSGDLSASFSDPFASVPSDPFSTPESNPFDSADNNSFNAFAADTTESEPSLPENTGKKGKSKKSKFVPPKAKIVPMVECDRAISLLGLILLAIVVGINLAAFLTAGLNSISFLICFDLFAIVLLCVPYLFWAKRRKGEVLTLYDVMLGLSLVFIVLACMVVLTTQAQKYGTKFKGTSYRPQTTQIR